MRQGIALDSALESQRSLLEAQIETSLEGILVVDAAGRMVSFNRRFVEMWGIPANVVENRSDEAALASVRDELVEPETFLERVRYLYEHPEEESHDELELLDGRTFDRYSAPLRGSGGAIHGRVWYFRDVTERRRAEAELRRRFEQLQTIYGVAAVADRADSLDELFDEALDKIAEGVGADRCSILLVEDSGVMRFRAWRNLSDHYRAATEEHLPWPPDTTNPEPVVVADVATEPTLAHLRDAILDEGISALVFVPLVQRGHLLGRFVLYWDRPHEIVDEEVRLSRAIASHVASAADRRRGELELAESRDQLSVIIEGVGDGITVQGADGRLVFANEAAAKMMGFRTAEEVLSVPAAEILRGFELLDESGAPFPPERLPGRRALRGDEEECLVGYRVRATGEERWSVVNATPIRNESGEIELAINIFHDVTDRRRVEQSLRFLAEASEVLSESLDYGRTLARVARLAVPQIADWCMVYMLRDDGSIERLAVEHAGGLHEGVLDRLRGYTFDPDAEIGVPAVLRTGEPLLVSHADGLLLASDVLGGERLAAELESLGIRSWMCVPLSARGRTLGAISLLSAESGRRFGESDLALAQELARRAALAVDNAGLHTALRESAAQLDTLFATAPVGLGLWDTDLRFVRVNRALAAINGLLPEEHIGRSIEEVVPGLPEVPAAMRRVLETGEAVIDLELSGESRAAPGLVRHWLASYYAVKTETGEIVGLGAVVHDVTEQRLAQQALAESESRFRTLAGKEQLARAQAESAQERLAFLAEASSALSASLDYEETLARVAELAVPNFADWSAVDVLERDGRLRRLAVAHADPAKADLASQLHSRYTPLPDRPGGARVVETGRPEIAADISDEEFVAAARDSEHLELLRAVGVTSYLCVPMLVSGRTVGALTFAIYRPGRRYGEDDLPLAEELARRAALAVENARLYREAEQRARAAQALTFVGDGVFLVDRGGYIRLWNRAAEAITRLTADDVVGRLVDRAIPGWTAIAPRIPVVASSETAAGRPVTVPLEVEGREVWLSISAVEFDEGTVFAFRDITEERGLERMKSEFVSTVSHELRTPLAAIYGAALTLRRGDLALAKDQRSDLLEVIAGESERLAKIVNDILWASRIESDNVQLTIERCDAAELADAVLRAARVQLPANVSVELVMPRDLPPLAADPDKVRQVLANLVDNAVKYSPDGGAVEIRLELRGGALRFVVADEGLGIPPGEQDRVFEKFYRLDPHLTRGIGGTGLGLYICRELVRRMAGRIWFEPDAAVGSTVVVELPLADPIPAAV